MPFIASLPNGKLAVIRINGNTTTEEKLTKTLFELSRDPSNTDEHFNPAVHAIDAIGAGLPGHVPLACRQCKEVDLPAEQEDRASEKPTFRDAWEDTGTAVRVNMPKARIIHMDRIRTARNVELEHESGSKFRQPPEIEVLFTAERQTKLKTLRDIPQTFDLSKYRTPTTLKAAWPTEIPRPVVNGVEL